MTSALVATAPVSVISRQVRRYEVHGLRIAVTSNDPDLIARVDDTYRPFAARGDWSNPPDSWISHARQPDGSERVTTSGDGDRVLRRPGDGLLAVLNAISAAVIGGLDRRGIVAVHAGVVRVDDGAVLLAGRSGAGKTTLVLELGRRGHAVLSDELALIAPDDRTVLPYPRGFHVRPATLDLVAEVGFLRDRPGHEVGGGSRWSLDPEVARASLGAPEPCPAPLRAIVLLDGVPSIDRPPHVRPVPSALAAVELLASAPVAGRDYARMLRRVSSIAAGIPCFRLTSGPLRATADDLLAHLGARR